MVATSRASGVGARYLVTIRKVRWLRYALPNLVQTEVGQRCGDIPPRGESVGGWVCCTIRATGLPPRTGSHALRHYYASLLIRHSESVKTVQARLGHASASETLDTYSHLWPDSDDRTREAVDAVLGNLADYLRTNHVPKQ